MKKIVLISCSSKKLATRIKVKAKDLYNSPIFKYSLQYAESLKPDKIFILSAKWHLLNINEKIARYDVTLSYVSPKVRKNKPKLKVLNKEEKQRWGKKVIKQLSKKSSLNNDRFIILAGKAYIKQIKQGFGDDNIIEPLKGKGQWERLKFLKSKLRIS